MRVILAPEPAPWLARALREDEDAESVVFAPWALPDTKLAELLPSRLRGAWRRRTIANARIRSLPGWPLLDAAIRRSGSARAIAWRLQQRVWVDAVTSRLLGANVSEVIAPSLCALSSFAATPKARHVLIEDLPGLRTLHADLDRAARALPECRFLQNFRAADALVVRQEQEYVLATTLKQRGRFAQERARMAGAQREAMVLLEPSEAAERPAAPRRLTHDPSSRNVLLAGTTSSRFGLEVALQALRSHPELMLLARRGEGSCASSLQHPQLELLRGPPPPLLAVLAPSWVECTPAEVDAAVEARLPVIATGRALGRHVASATVHALDLPDASAVATALGALRAAAP